MDKLSLEELEEQLAKQFISNANTSSSAAKVTPKSSPAPQPTKNNATLSLLMGLDNSNTSSSNSTASNPLPTNTSNQSANRTTMDKPGNILKNRNEEGLDIQNIMLLIKEGFKYLTNSEESISPTVFTATDGCSFLAVVQFKNQSLQGTHPTESRAQALLLLLQKVESKTFEKHGQVTASRVAQSDKQSSVKVSSKPTQPLESLNNPNPVRSRGISEHAVHGREETPRHDNANSHPVSTRPSGGSFDQIPPAGGRGHFHPGRGGLQGTHSQPGRGGPHRVQPQQAVPRLNLVEASDFDKYFG